MKLKIILGVLLVGFFGSLRAQGLFFRLGGGYNFAYGANVSFTSTAVYPNTTFKSVALNYASSINFGFRAGYLFTKNVGVSLGIDYHAGNKVKTADTFKRNDLTAKVDNRSEFEGSISAVLFSPSLVLTSDLGKKWVPYLQAGLLVGVPMKLNSVNNNRIQEESFDFPSENKSEVTVTRYERTYRPALGFSLALGTDFHINDKWGLYGELNLGILRFRPDNGKMTEFTQNGIDKLGEKTLSEREFIFVEEGDTEKVYYDNKADPNQPLSTINWNYLPYNFIGLRLGVKYRL